MVEVATILWPLNSPGNTENTTTKAILKTSNNKRYDETHKSLTSNFCLKTIIVRVDKVLGKNGYWVFGFGLVFGNGKLFGI